MTVVRTSELFLFKTYLKYRKIVNYLQAIPVVPVEQGDPLNFLVWLNLAELFLPPAQQEGSA